MAYIKQKCSTILKISLKNVKNNDEKSWIHLHDKVQNICLKNNWFYMFKRKIIIAVYLITFKY